MTASIKVPGVYTEIQEGDPLTKKEPEGAPVTEETEKTEPEEKESEQKEAVKEASESGKPLCDE